MFANRNNYNAANAIFQGHVTNKILFSSISDLFCSRILIEILTYSGIFFTSLNFFLARSWDFQQLELATLTPIVALHRGIQAGSEEPRQNSLSHATSSICWSLLSLQLRQFPSSVSCSYISYPTLHRLSSLCPLNSWYFNTKRSAFSNGVEQTPYFHFRKWKNSINQYQKLAIIWFSFSRVYNLSSTSTKWIIALEIMILHENQHNHAKRPNTKMLMAPLRFSYINFSTIHSPRKKIIFVKEKTHSHS